MAVYLKKFSTHQEYDGYINGSGAILPNVSICEDTKDVHYNPPVIVTGVTLNKSELSLAKGAAETLVATVMPSNASNKSVTWQSSNDSVFTVNSNGLVTAVGDSGNANITVTTVDGGYTAQCAARILDPYVGHEYVEIGGVKWATMNIGATSITDKGLYFQWGDTQGYTASQVGSGAGQKYFGWADYKYGNGTSDPGDTGMTKYNKTDGKTVLEASDDAVIANWGGSWRMPTTAEYVALGNAVNTAWAADYQGSGVAGLVCTDKTDSSKVLFFPACGICYNGSVRNVGSYGYYRSSSVDSSNVRRPYGLYFDNGKVNWQSDSLRYYGFPVRGVVG